MITENPVDGSLLSGLHQEVKALAQYHQQEILILLMSQLPDNAIPLAEYHAPSLTTIRLTGSQPGWAGGERLIRIIHGEGLNDASLSLESKLITRQANT